MNNYSSYKQTIEAIKNSETTCLQIVKGYLDKISSLNTSINAFVEVYDKDSLEQAKRVDLKIHNGNHGKLAGMIIGIKDNICYEGKNVTAASNILKGFESLYSATVVTKLLSEDAIIIGRLNCDEFAMGSSNENSIYGEVKNPLNFKKTPGGSSGGSAAAVASGLCLAALGSDTGGSIRQPSSFCGVVGLKPTYSRVSRHGLIAYASSFDQIGTITNNLEDAGLILSVIAGKDKNDSTSSSVEVEDYNNLEEDNEKKKIAIISEYLENKTINVEIKELIKEKIVQLEKRGHLVERVSFPFLEQLVPTYYILTTAEASSNLARYNGLHYGNKSLDKDTEKDVYTKSRMNGFGKEVKRRIMLGTFVLSAGYHEEYFTKAQKIRRLIQNYTNKIFNEFDFILGPTTPHTAFDLGKKHKDPTIMYLEDIFTVHANLSGNPAISIPLFTHSNGMPFGIQLIADNFKEKELLSFADYLTKSK